MTYCLEYFDVYAASYFSPGVDNAGPYAPEYFDDYGNPYFIASANASRLKLVRDDVRTAIENLPRVVARGIIPRGVWVPQFERHGDALPAIIVAPVRQEQALIARGRYETETLVQVAVFEAFGEDAEAAGDAGHVLLEAIIEGLLGHQIGGTLNLTCMAAETKTLTGGEWWREQRMFGAVVELRLR